MSDAQTGDPYQLLADYDDQIQLLTDGDVSYLVAIAQSSEDHGANKSIHNAYEKLLSEAAVGKKLSFRECLQHMQASERKCRNIREKLQRYTRLISRKMEENDIKTEGLTLTLEQIETKQYEEMNCLAELKEYNESISEAKTVNGELNAKNREYKNLCKESMKSITSYDGYVYSMQNAYGAIIEDMALEESSTSQYAILVQKFNQLTLERTWFAYQNHLLDMHKAHEFNGGQEMIDDAIQHMGVQLRQREVHTADQKTLLLSKCSRDSNRVGSTKWFQERSRLVAKTEYGHSYNHGVLQDMAEYEEQEEILQPG